jgi:hypothetical protein
LFVSITFWQAVLILVSAWVTLIVEPIVYTPGVNSRLSPTLSAELIVATELDGVTT